MGGHAALVSSVEVDETVYLVVVGRGRDVMTMLSVVQVGLLSEAKT